MKSAIGLAATAVLSLVAMSALAAETPAADADLAKFRKAYAGGEGLAYVVVKDDAGEQVYRYGDVSRQAALAEPRAYMLFTCYAPPLVSQRYSNNFNWLSMVASGSGV